ncbi:hypothetical protein PENTCL1PPCAC_15195 [Pristionchus entomophagus]|uniref:Uncharacterized protein n=1 Tax=Pristionchus entomophagus TaxID=358040 RepID=A0AAV5TBS4_9BILA|nr:hypothetical protein PENTCL1PPCAC_15195 [Pristionchus entomophagus]
MKCQKCQELSIMKLSGMSGIVRNVRKPDILNYSNEYIDLPLNASSSLISMISYSVIIAKMHYARIQTAGIEQAGSKLLHFIHGEQLLLLFLDLRNCTPSNSPLWQQSTR